VVAGHTNGSEGLGELRGQGGRSNLPVSSHVCQESTLNSSSSYIFHI
jgi:hypothetical protein